MCCVKPTLSNSFEIVKRGFQKEDILYFVSSPLLCFSEREELVAFVNEKNISGKEKFEYYVAKENKIFNLILKIKDSDIFGNYSNIILEIAKELEENLLKYIAKELELGLAQEASFDSQALCALEEVVLSLNNFKSEVSLNDFSLMLFTALDSKQISSLPSYADQVFVGDSNKSFFSGVKYLSFKVGLISLGISPANAPSPISLKD